MRVRELTIRIYFKGKCVEVVIDYDFKEYVSNIYEAETDNWCLIAKKVDGKAIAIRARDIDYVEQI